LNHIRTKSRGYTLPDISLKLKVVSSNSVDKITVHGVLDGKPFELGSLETHIATAIVPLLSRRLVRTQAVAMLPFRSSNRLEENQPKAMIEIFVNLFGEQEDGDRIGDYLSAEKVYLQHPRFPDAGYEYKNPHILSQPTNPIITQTTLTGGIDIKSRKQAEESGKDHESLRRDFRISDSW
jgi:hypothetical protein